MRCYLAACPEQAVCDNCEGCEEHCCCEELFGELSFEGRMQLEDGTGEPPYFWETE